MANKKINALPLAGSVSDSMQLETDIGGTTANKITAPMIRTYTLDSVYALLKTTLLNGANVTITSNDGLKTLTFAAAGDVVGTVSSTNNAIVRMNGTGGKTIRNSTVFVDDSGNFTGVGDFTGSGSMNMNGNSVIGGSITLSNNNGGTSSFLWSTRTRLTSPADGRLRLTNNGQTGFTRLTLGLESNVFPALKVNAAELQVRLGDDSAAGTLATGGFVAGTRSVTASTTVTQRDYTVKFDATSGAISQALPTTGISAGQIYVLKKTDASVNTVTLTGTFDGATDYVLITQNQSVRVQFNGTNYDII